MPVNNSFRPVDPPEPHPEGGGSANFFLIREKIRHLLFRLKVCMLMSKKRSHDYDAS
jgi:hypothetical protein